MVGHLVAKNGLRPNSFLGGAKMKMTINSPWLIFEVSHHYKPPIRRGDVVRLARTLWMPLVTI